VVVENVGLATWDQSFRSLAPGGRLVVCGATAGNRVELALPVVWFKQLEIIGSSMANRSQFAATLNLVASGRLPIPIDATYRFGEVPEAFRHLESGRQLGKVVITFD
jgi:NADPH:quinone reductase-like Zn-dependent oxidoreductase